MEIVEVELLHILQMNNTTTKHTAITLKKLIHDR